MKFHYHITHPGHPPLTKHPEDAGFDLRTTVAFSLAEGEQVTVPLGVEIALPQNTVGLICSRSGLARDYGIGVVGGHGTVDSGYRGELKVTLGRAFHPDAPPAEFKAGHRVCQLLILPLVPGGFEEVGAERWDIEFSRTDRGRNGFGSTGR